MNLKTILTTLVVALTLSMSAVAQSRIEGKTVVLWEDHFPFTDAAPVTRGRLAELLPSAIFASHQELISLLANSDTRLLVLPFGSAFPEQDWNAIYGFLQRGGNLLTLGGRPFTRAAYLEDGKWKLRAENYAFARKLFISDYQPTPASSKLKVQTNSDLAPLELPAFSWDRAYSLTVRLSDAALSPRDGAAGTLDAHLDALAWGVDGKRRLAAPAVQIDHFLNHFVGGRWIMLSCELSDNFYESPSAQKLIAALAERAFEGAEEFAARPQWPLFVAGEPWRFQIQWNRKHSITEPVRAEITIHSESSDPIQKSFDLTPMKFPFTADIELPAAARSGFHTVTASLYAGGKLRCVYHTGFWIRDEQFLRSGPRITVNKDFFESDGRPLPIVGTTYMANDVQRQYFTFPNPFVWDRDMAEIQANGLNMLRSGWWSGWDKVTQKDGTATEASLRTVEAFLMTARKHDLPVQFNFFAFIPEVLGGKNPYLDPEALQLQQKMMQSVASRFKDVPYLIWDLINEPSFDNPQRLWSTRPNYDLHELTAWNDYLKSHYADRNALADAWRSVPVAADLPVPPPTEQDFSPRSSNQDGHPIAVHDFYMFAQAEFARWAQTMRAAIRATGSEQLITVGQDEGGGADRLSPAFYASALDFTTTHTWWLNDALLWDSLVAKLPGQPMLVQETGIQHEFHLDSRPRRDPVNESLLLERKVALAMGTSAGVIQWLWNTNAYMPIQAEVTIGSLRLDETEKPETAVLRNLASFAAAARDHFREPALPEVAIVTSQSFQYSALNGPALEAQTRAVRALHYDCHVPAYVITENQLSHLDNPKLVLLPSAQALTDAAWQHLLAYVERGGHLLITGSMERDEHWQPTERLAAIGINAKIESLTFRNSRIKLPTKSMPISFDGGKQERLESLRFPGDVTFVDHRHGKGRIFITSVPVELAENPGATAELYGWALQQSDVKSPFEAKHFPDGVLIRPVVFADSVLYLFDSESGEDQTIDLKDRLTGGRLHFPLGAQRSALLLLRKTDGKVIAKYGVN